MNPRILACLLLVVACGDGDKTSATADTTATSTGDGPSTGDPPGTSSTGSTDPTTGGSAEATATSTGVDPTTGGATTTTGATTDLTSGTTDLTSGTTDATTDATTGGPPDGCHNDADCDPDMGESCFNADESNCGACQVPDAPCFDQSECDIGLLCVPFDAPCACDPGVGQCVPVLPCQNDDQCALDEFCEQNACVAKTCDNQMLPCPPLFDCVPDSEPANHCVRHPCETDDDCDGGFCVENRCFEMLGVCMPPAP